MGSNIVLRAAVIVVSGLACFTGGRPNKKLKVLNEKIILARAGLDSALQESALADNKSASVSLTCVLKPSEFNSSGGAGHTLLDDGSVLLQDDSPDLDTYSVTVTLGPEPVVGFLLEALTDPSLPGTGPGRGDAARPNFVLNSFEARLAISADDTTSKSIPLTDARADFSQKNFDVANAIDSDLKSGWAIGPQFKRSHWAAFRIAFASELDAKLNQVSLGNTKKTIDAEQAQSAAWFAVSTLLSLDEMITKE